MSTAYSAQFQIDQPDGAGSGSPGIARTDLWRATRVNLTPTASPPGATHRWSLVRPRGSTAQFLDPLTGLPNPDCATPYILQDKWGSYLIQHSVNNGAYTSQMIAAVKFDDDGTLLKLGWRYPALNEGWLDASDPDGWKKPLEDIFDSLYGVISSLENHGGYYGDDGGERRAGDPTVQAERRVRLRELGNTLSQYCTYTILSVLDQRQIAQTVIQLVEFEGEEPSGPAHRFSITPGSQYGLMLVDALLEQPAQAIPFTMLVGILDDIEPLSIQTFGTQVAVVFTEAVVVFELAQVLEIGLTSMVDWPDITVVTNPDVGGGGFGTDCRVAFALDRGIARMFMTDKVSNKIYSARIDMPARIGGTVVMNVTSMTADVVWTGLPTDLPHGIVVDDSGGCWVALQGAGQIVRFNIRVVDAQHVMLIKKDTFDDPSNPTELVFDGVFVVATHSYLESSPPVFTGSKRTLPAFPILSDLITSIAVGSTAVKQSTLSVYNGVTGMIDPLPVNYGPGCVALSRDHIWFSCAPYMMSNDVGFIGMLPVRFNPVSGRCSPGWSIQQFADYLYTYLGSPVSITMEPGTLAIDEMGALYCAFALEESLPGIDQRFNDIPMVAVTHVLRVPTVNHPVETDTLAVRSMGLAGGLLMALPGDQSGMGTEPSGRGVVVPLVGSDDGDTVLWDGVHAHWKVGAGGTPPTPVESNNLTDVKPAGEGLFASDPVYINSSGLAMRADAGVLAKQEVHGFVQDDTEEGANATITVSGIHAYTGLATLPAIDTVLYLAIGAGGGSRWSATPPGTGTPGVRITRLGQVRANNSIMVRIQVIAQT